MTGRAPLQVPTFFPNHSKSFTLAAAESASFHTFPVTHHMATSLSKKLRARNAFVALLLLVAIVSSVFLFHSSQIIYARNPEFVGSHSSEQIRQALEQMRLRHSSIAHNHTRIQPTGSSQIQLDTAQELAAVSSFLASLPQNVIPSTVDPNLPLDPGSILDFDVRGSRAVDEVQAMVDDTWVRNPVFLYSKVYSPASREIKSLLASLRLRPAPTIIDVDTRTDAEVLKPLITRLTSSPDLPVLLIKGIPVGGLAEVRTLHAAGELRALITEAGAVIDGRKMKKHRR